jgi:hypothetical protein
VIDSVAVRRCSCDDNRDRVYEYRNHSIEVNDLRHGAMECRGRDMRPLADSTPELEIIRSHGSSPELAERAAREWARRWSITYLDWPYLFKPKKSPARAGVARTV